MKIISLNKDQYPYLLKQISQLPETMDLAGTLPPDDHKFLCVVGSRQHSDYGKEACKKLILGLRGFPVVIVSGLANGIDSIAHEAALEAGLKTVAFPGSGLSQSVLSPSNKRALARRIVESGGALLSPFPFEHPSTEWTFPFRNRLMAGMSHATLVVEARKKSGTLITADDAGKLGRDVLVVLGSIFSELSYGTNMLLRRGATPIASSEDILESLGFKIIRADGMTRPLPNFAEMSLSEDQQTIIGYLRSEVLNSSELIERMAIPSSRFNILATELELLGLIVVSNGNYRLA